MSKWTKETIPKYLSDRVTIEIIYDKSPKRHLHHKQVIKIDNEIVDTKTFYEDDDFGSNSDEIPDSQDQWNNFVASLPDK